MTKTSGAMALATLMLSGVGSASATDALGWERTWLDAVRLNWQPPVVPGSNIAGIDMAQWTPVSTFPLLHACTVCDGEYFYSGANPFNVYDMQGRFVRSVTIPGLSDVYRLTTDGKNIYGIVYERPGIFQIDFNLGAVTKVIPTYEEMYQLSYIPTLDNGKGGFLVGNTSVGRFCNMNGEPLEGTLNFYEDSGNKSLVYGAVYANGKLYAYANCNTFDRKLYEYDLGTCKPTGRVFDLNEHTGTGGVTGNRQGRNIIGYTYPGHRRYLLFIDYDGLSYYGTRVLAGEQSLLDGLTGYSLYRNGEKINSATLDPQTFEFEDNGLAEATDYNYELKPVVNGEEQSSLATSLISLPYTRTLPVVDDFNSYQLTADAPTLYLLNEFWTISPKLSAQKWSVRNNNVNDKCIQFSYTPDLKYRQTLTSRKLDAPQGHNVRMSLEYACNTYISSLSETEWMNIDVSTDGGNTWQTADSIKYKSNTKYTVKEIDLTPLVAGKTFQVRFKGRGEEPDKDYNWQFDNIRIWDYEPVNIAGKVILSGAAVTEGTKLIFTRHDSGTVYESSVTPAGTFSIGDIQTGVYDVVVAKGTVAHKIADFKVDRSYDNYRIDVPGGYFTGDTELVDVKIAPEGIRTVEIPLTNSGNDSAHSALSLLFANDGTGEVYGNSSIDVTHRWDKTSSFILPDNKQIGAVYYQGSIYLHPTGTALELYKYTVDGTLIDTIPLSTASGEKLTGNLSGYFVAGDRLMAYVNGNQWGSPKISASIMPVDLENGKFLDTEKTELPQDFFVISGAAYNLSDDSYYFKDNSNHIYNVSSNGEIIRKFDLPQIGYVGSGFDTFSADGPYLWMAKNNTSNMTLHRYNLAKGQFAQETFNVNDYAESAFNSAGQARLSNCTLTASSLVYPGYFSLLATQTLSVPGGQKPTAQVIVMPLFPYETWLTGNAGNASLAPSQSENLILEFNAEGLEPLVVKAADVVISASNFSEDLVIPVRLTVDPSVASQYPVASALKAEITGDYQVALTWQQPSTKHAVKEYKVYRDGKPLDGTASEPEYTDILPNFGTQGYVVKTIYDDNYAVYSDTLDVEVKNPNWGVPAEELAANVVGRRNVVLTWNGTPKMPNAFYDDFESYEPFKVNSIGQWKLIDGDGAWTYKNNNIDYPGEGERMAAMVYNNNKTTPAGDYYPGDDKQQYVVFTSGKTQLLENDDWMISPGFSLKESGVFRFDACTATSAYGNEPIMVGYSVTGDEQSDFIWLTEKPIEVQPGWGEYKFNVPADTKHVAIRHLGVETYLLFVDNVYVGPENAFTSVEGYNVYKGSEKLNETLLTAPKYIDYGLEDGSYAYNVEVVYENEATSENTIGDIEIDTSHKQNPPRDFKAEVVDDQRVEMTWKAPELADTEELRYDDGAVANSIGGVDELYAAIKWDAETMSLYDGYYLTSMRFHIAEPVNGVTPLIYCDGKLVRTGTPFKAKAGEFNDYVFDEPLLIEAGHSYMAGYKAECSSGYYPLSHDKGPGTPSMSDLYSEDGETWFSLLDMAEQSSEFNINWNIAVSLEILPDQPEEDNEATVTKAPAIRMVSAPAEIHVPAQRLKVADTARFAKDNVVRFMGYNVYANEEALGTSILVNPIFTTQIPETTTEYYATAVYSNGAEVPSEKQTVMRNGIDVITSSLKYYPNPVVESLHVDGQFDSLALYSLGGLLMYENTDAADNAVIDMTSCPQGIYMLRVTADGKTQTFKIVKQ